MQSRRNTTAVSFEIAISVVQYDTCILSRKRPLKLSKYLCMTSVLYYAPGNDVIHNTQT